MPGRSRPILCRDLPAIVCVHGLGGTPRSITPIISSLQAAGYNVAAPTLPGHDLTPQDLTNNLWQDWLKCVLEAASRQNETHEQVVVVGQSLGATLAVLAALELDYVIAAAAVNPVALPADPDALEHFDYLINRGRTMQPSGSPDLHDTAAVDDAYDELPIKSLIELSRAGEALYSAAPLVSKPLFIATSALDSVVDPANSQTLADRVAGFVTRVWLPESGHVAALDLDRELLCQQLLAWLVNLTDASAVLPDESASS